MLLCGGTVGVGEEHACSGMAKVCIWDLVDIMAISSGNSPLPRSPCSNSPWIIIDCFFPLGGSAVVLLEYKISSLGMEYSFICFCDLLLVAGTHL